MKNKKYPYTKHIVVSEKIWVRLREQKKLLNAHNTNEALQMILDNWEYNVPIK